MATTSANVTITNSNGDYALGYTNSEHNRLIRQATRIAPYTERLLREAGIGPGQRVLDLGSGVGDVAMLLARIVGPSGAIVGIERDPTSIARANARAAEAGLRNISFTQADVNQIDSDEPFDAAVGRFILMFLPDPASVLRSLTRLVRPGGVLAFQEPHLDSSARLCGAVSPLVQTPFLDPRNVLALRRGPGDGAKSLPHLSGSWSTCTGDAYRDADGERRKFYGINL